MTDENERPSVEEQRAHAAEHVKYSGDEGMPPDFEVLRRTKQNFALGRSPDAPIFRNTDEAYEHLRERREERREAVEHEAKSKAAAEELERDAQISSLRNFSPDDQRDVDTLDALGRADQEQARAILRDAPAIEREINQLAQISPSGAQLLKERWDARVAKWQQSHADYAAIHWPREVRRWCTS